MNYLQIRQKFREISGRFDLIGDAPTYTDTGGGFFINEGRKFLDRLDETQKSWATHYSILKTGFYSVSFPYCRAIKEVWLGSTTEKWQVEKKRLQDLISGYMLDIPSLRSTGQPKYYAPCISRYVPENATPATLNAFLGWLETPGGNKHEYNAILFSVPTDTDLTVIINGLFYSRELVNDEDTNYWSDVHPLLLISAAMRQIEVINRNTQGLNDWDNVIGKDMKAIGSDLVEELISETDEMDA